MSTFNPRDYVRRVNNTAQLLLNLLNLKKGDIPIALVLGSGLKTLADNIQDPIRIPYKELPKFPLPQAEGHEGVFIYGTISGVPVLCLSGRTHYYEVALNPLGIFEVVFATHVMASMGMQLLITTNAVGSFNSNFIPGDLVVMKDHLGGFMPNPLVGPHLDFGNNLYFQPQLPEQLFEKELYNLFVAAGAEISRGKMWGDRLRVKAGDYAGMMGRTYESPLECKVLKDLGADIVGMSTYMERVIAMNRRLPVFSVSLVANLIAPNHVNNTTSEEVLSVLNDEKNQLRVKATFERFFAFCRDEGFLLSNGTTITV